MVGKFKLRADFCDYHHKNAGVSLRPLFSGLHSSACLKRKYPPLADAFFSALRYAESRG
jgi:hypothetical protein